MDNKKIILIISIIIALFLLLLTYFLIAKTRFSPKQERLSSCNSLIYNGENAFNIVFFADKKESEKYANFLLGTSPLNKNKENFNFYYIDDYEPECSVYEKMALLCYSKELIKKAGSCPNDFIVVVSDKYPGLRSSAYMNVMSINVDHPSTVMTHEFGHVFANLAEEYIPAKLPRKSRNCAANCEEFGEEKNGCYEGCSRADYFRSIEAGVMRTLTSNEFGIFNEKLIEERFSKKSAGISGFVIEEGRDCNSEKYVLIEGNYENGRIEIIGKRLERGCVGGNGAGGFDYKLLMSNEEVSREGEFNPELIFSDAPGEFEIDGETFENKGEFLLKLSEIKEAKELQIFRENELLAEVNLQDVGARLCRK